ncbi:hypothetical protein Taro_022734 [Colocasia esculenta]|uniref:Frataxin n=1 Tax=Colocasia esculenta TaxID=4460 RepID=A0A843V4I9_COLES|nr:hypothetical protein [Colocasia esculenta]
MASSMSRRNLIRRLSALSTTSLHPLSSSSFPAVVSSSSSSSSLLHRLADRVSGTRTPVPTSIPRAFFTSTSSPWDIAGGPTTIDYRSVLQEDEFHRLSDETIHDLQERFEEYGDEIQIDGFDIDYGNQVLTLKLGTLGTYVINKQTPNRQIWLSSPVRYFALVVVPFPHKKGL